MITPSPSNDARTIATARALPVLLALLTLVPVGPALGQEPGAEIDGRELIVTSWPPVTIELDSAFTYLGARSFQLYDVATAEAHVFVDVGPDSVVDRLYWFQLEEVLPESDHRYDYSHLPRAFDEGGLGFVADARFGPGYALESVDREGDTAEVLRLLESAGVRMPDEMMRLRMVALDDGHRRELLIVYLEDLALHDLSAAVLDAAGDAAWRRLADRLEQRARDGMRIERRDVALVDTPDTGERADTAAAAEPAAAEAPVAAIERPEVRAFRFEHELLLDASPAAVWNVITGDIGDWWDHNFSGDPARFFLEPWPGGRFLEVFEEGSRDGVLHGTVTLAKRPELLRFEGPLGLTGYAVHGVYTYELEPVGEGTRLTLSTHMIGELEEGWPELVERVWRHFLFDRLKPYMEGGL